MLKGRWVTSSGSPSNRPGTTRASWYGSHWSVFITPTSPKTQYIIIIVIYNFTLFSLLVWLSLLKLFLRESSSNNTAIINKHHHHHHHHHHHQPPSTSINLHQAPKHPYKHPLAYLKITWGAGDLPPGLGLPGSPRSPQFRASGTGHFKSLGFAGSSASGTKASNFLRQVPWGKAGLKVWFE